MKRTGIGCMAAALFLLTVSCGGASSVRRDRGHLTGGDRDSHGCIASAGYRWSGLLKDCIRPFEKGIRLGSVMTDGSFRKAAYLVFDADSGKVELFLPEKGRRPVLERESVEGRKYAGPGPYEVSFSDGVWEIRFRKRVVYSSRISGK